MMKLRARSRSFGSKEDTRSSKLRAIEQGDSDSSNNNRKTAKDDINIKPSNNSSRVEFPLELARSLQAFATSLSLPSTGTTISAAASTSSTPKSNKKEVLASPPSQSTSRAGPTSPRLKPILRSSTTSDQQRDGPKTTCSSSHTRQASSVSSTGSSKQISFLLPEDEKEATTNTRSGPAATSGLRHAAPRHSKSHSRQNSESSTAGSVPSPLRTSTTSTSSPKETNLRQKEQKKTYASAVPVTGAVPPQLPLPPPPVPVEDDILHIQKPPSSTMHIRRVSDTPEVRRSSIGERLRCFPQALVACRNN